MACVTALSIVGCGGEDQSAAQRRPTNSNGPVPTQSEVPHPAEALFNIDHVPVFRLTLPEANWLALKASAALEEYTVADLEFEGQPVGKVGLRFKGAYSTLLTCLDETGSLLCPKLSMKLEFGFADPTLDFFGLRHLNLNAYVRDDSKIHEALAYSLFRAMGVHSLRAAWANVIVNGESYGLFGMVEQIDGGYTHEHWPSDDQGNLYKEAWPSTDDPEYYELHLENNHLAPDNNAILTLAQALERAQAAGTPAVAQALDQSMSLDYLRRFMAVDEAILDVDGITSFYTEPSRSWTINHNFYLYEEEKRPYFWLLPWDLDGTFNISNGKNNVPLWTEIPSDCARVYPVYNRTSYAVAPGCEPLFQGIAADLPAFGTIVDDMLRGPLDPVQFTARVDALAAFIESSVAADPKLDRETSVELFHSKVAEIKRNLPILTARAQAIGHGHGMAPLWLDATGTNDFEAVQPLDAMVSVQVYANSASLPSVSVESNDITGRALRLNFAFYDDPTPARQWSVYLAPLANAPQNLAGYRGVRLRAAASRAGTGRIEIVSQVRDAKRSYTYEGWPVHFSNAWNDYELLFADATLPDYAIAADQLPFADVIAAVVQLRVVVDCMNRNPTTGQLGYGTDGKPLSDSGYVDVDDIEFIAGY